MNDAQMRHRQMQQLNSARLALIRAIENGTATARDRFDNKMTPGALVAWAPPIAPIWELVAVDVPPAGSVAPGTIELTLQCRIPALMQANMPNQGFILVGMQSAPGHAELTSPSAGAGPADGDKSTDQPPVPSGLVDPSGQAIGAAADTAGDGFPGLRPAADLIRGKFGSDPGEGGDDGENGPSN